MSLLQSGNPAMSALERWDENFTDSATRPRVMTIGGTVQATAILLAIVAATGVITFQSIMKASVAAGNQLVLPGWAWPGMILAFISFLVVGLVIYRKPKAAPIIAPIHAAIQGVWAGALSAIIPAQFLNSMEVFSGGATTLVAQAVLATVGICAAMLTGYATGILRVGPFFQKVIITLGIGLLFYIVALFLLQMLGVGIWNGFRDTGPIGIIFTVFCLGLASLYLLLDFKFIETGVKEGAPKYMEWVGAWGLMVTLVWVYIEVLRLLAKLKSSD
ncbi:MAG: Bax inhibitor-1/YccA family protein [Phycisphaerales bacterium]|nr:Bax inhibitor-1/YccA family protein [Planctomycetota bacterium]MCH8509605.1 Bax inhibitor-1/YccA family protein [Phycisphaerales bacterium]